MLNPFNQIGQSTPFPRRNSNSSGDVIIEQPAFIRPFASEAAVPVYPRLYATDFITDPPLAENHLNTDWQVATNSGFTSIAFESLADTTNKTDVLVTDELDASTLHYARLRYRGDGGGISLYSATREFTTGLEQGLEVETIAWAADSVFDYYSSAFNSDRSVFSASRGFVNRTDSGTDFAYSNQNITGQIAFGVCWSGTEFLAVGGAGRVTKSVDGINWKSFTSSTSNQLRDVVFGGGIFVAVGSSGTIVTSADGETWTTRTSGTTDNLLGVAFNGSVFATCGQAGRMLTSADGITWTAQTSGTANQLNKIRFHNLLFLAVGNSGTLITSPDGTTWTTQATGVAVVLNGVTFDGTLYLIAGASNTVRTSPDLVTWTARTTGSGGTTVWNFAEFDTERGLFFVGSTIGRIYSSANAATWAELITFSNASSLLGIGFGNGLHIACGASGRISKSNDTRYWTQQTISGSPSGREVRYLNSNWVLVGNTGVIYTSPDGTTWTAQTSGTTTQLNSVNYGAGLYVVVGLSGVIRTSPTFATWTAQTSGTANALNAIIFDNGIFVVVGNSGTILTSSDGLTWTGRSSGTAQNLNEVTWTGVNFVVVGGGGVILTSPDGITWTARTSGVAAILYGVAKSNNLVVVPNGLANLYSTDDGLTWTSSAGRGLLNRRKIIWNGQKFLSIDAAAGTVVISASKEIV